jgi:adenylate cyclase
MRELIFSAGIPIGASPEQQRTIVFHRFAVLPSIPTALLFILVAAHERFWTLLVGALAGLVFVTSSFLLSVAGRHLPSKVFYNYGCVVAFTIVTLALGDKFGGHAFFLLTGIYAIFVYDKNERGWMLGGLGASVLLYCGFSIAARESMLPPWDAITTMPAWIGIGLDVFVVVFAVIFALFMNSTNEATETNLVSLREQVEERFVERSREVVQLRDLDIAKSRFFSNISHEFRTPLTLILGPLEQEIEARGPDTPSGRRLAVAARNGQRLLRLINQLLDVAKLEAGAMPLVLAPTDVAALVASTAAAFETIAAKQGIALHVASPPAGIWCRVDADQLQKVLLNLLSNAFKFTRAGSITVGVRKIGAELELQVTDTGIGIPPAELEHVFDRFHQVDGAQSREQKGTGIGLALVKELVELHGGRVSVASTMHEGTTFWVRLPVAPANDEPGAVVGTAPPAVAGARIPERLEVSTLDDGPPQAVAAATFSTDGTAARVLLVEDNPDMRAYVRSCLGAEYEIIEAINGTAGLELAKAHAPDLVISDVMMPGMDGYDLLARLKGDAATSSVPVVLLTAKASDATRLEGIEAGADDYLAKPFNPKELRARIRNLLLLKAQAKDLAALNRHLTERVLKRYLPPALVDEIVEGRRKLDDSPRTVVATILFADLVGFTEMSQDLRAVEMSERLNEYLANMIDVIFASGGSIDKFIGDSIMVIFGAPVTMDPKEQATSAAACALAMQARMGELSATWQSSGLPGLRMRIGIHQGPVVVGNFGDARRSDFTAIGPTVNLASRIETQAEPGAVFVSGEVCDYLPRSMFEKVGSFSLKGVKGEVTCYRLTARTDLRSGATRLALPASPERT